MMNLRVLLFLSAITFPFYHSSAQLLRPPIQAPPGLKVDNWQIDQGLPVNSIITVAQTADGWLFFGTEEGMVRFDGDSFFLMNNSNVPELPVNFISTLLGGRDTSLWIGTEGDGLVRFKNNKFIIYNKSNGLSDNRIFALCEDSDGGLWVGTSGGGLNYLKNNNIIKVDSINGLASNYIRSIAIDARSRIWVGTQKGLSVIDHGHIRSYYKKDGLTDDFIEALAFDNDKNLWIGTKSGGLNVFKLGKFTAYTVKEGLSSNAVTAICLDANGMLWIGTNGGGITRMVDGQCYPFTTKQGLSSDLIVTLFKDREGNMWAGSSGAGIDRIKTKLIQTLTGRDGLSGDVILPVFQGHDGVLWLGIAGKGINRLENGKVKTVSRKDGLPDFLILTITEDQDHGIWIGTAGGGLTRYVNGKFTTYTTANGLSNNVVNAVYCDKSGALWAGTTGGGVNRFCKGKFKAFTARNGLSHDNVTCILQESHGDLLIGTSGGLNRIRGEKITVISQKDGLSDNYILSLYEDRQGNLWVGTAANGFNLIRNGKITQFTMKDGLINEVVLWILEDDHGYFWISCNKGIYKIKKQDLIDFADLKIKSLIPVSYGKMDGMETTECNGGVSPAGCKTRDGLLVFPTMKGLSIIDPNLMKTSSSYFSPVYLEKFLVDGHQVETTTPLSIPSYAKRFEFQFAALNYTSPEKIKYRCMLVGFDKDWINCGTNRIAYYTNIPGGNYVFIVMAANESGQWDKKSAAELKFRLTPPFYGSFLFYLILVAFFLLLMFFATYYFVERFQRNRLKLLVEERTQELNLEVIAQKQTQEVLRKMNEELLMAQEQAKSGDLLKTAFLELEAFSYSVSHDLKAPLRHIIGFIDLFLENKSTELTAEENGYLEKIVDSATEMGKLIDALLSFSKLNQAALRKTRIHSTSMVQKIIKFFEPEIKNRKITFRVEPLPDIEGDEDLIHQVWTNLISNAIKYTGKKPAAVIEIGSISTDAETTFFVKDNGAGFNMKYIEKLFRVFHRLHKSRDFEGVGIGLANVNRIVMRHGGYCRAEGEPDKGATFYFCLPTDLR